MTHPRIDDPDRLAALRATDLLDHDPGPAFERIARLAQRLLKVPIAAVSLVDDRRQLVLGQVGLPPRLEGRLELPLPASLCAVALGRGEALVVPDLRAAPLVADASAWASVGAAAYAGVPIETADGHQPGVLCVVAREPRAWTDDDLATLRELASSAAESIDLRAARNKQRDTEARYRDFVASSPEAIWRFEVSPAIDVSLPAEEQVVALFRDAHLAECNDALARMHGFEKAADILGARLADMMPASEARNVGYLRALVANRYRHNDFPSMELDRAGRERHFLNSLVGVVEDGALVRAWGTQRDVTERRAAERERAALLEGAEQARVEAESANRLKDEFLSTLSHELRTPLNAILGWTRMLLTGQVPEERREHAVTTIERNAQVQARLVDDILDVSRIVSGKLPLHFEAVEPSAVVWAAVDSVRPAAEARRIQLQVAIDRDLGTLVADPSRVQQVVWNLLSNAVKFTPRGGKVTVFARRLDEHLELEVTDTGQGIEPDFVPHVFERFRQADAGSARLHGGLGLGLAIVRHLVELHGGSVAVRSEGVGRGATFTARFPVGSDAPGDARWSEPGAPLATAAIATDAPTEQDPSLEGVHVLVVDDEVDARELLRSVLQSCDATVTVASSAAEAGRLLRAVRPDVMVSDIGMPGEDGLALIARVRSWPGAEGGNTPAVALTAFARPEDRARAISAGFTAYLTKPVDLTLLLKTLARVLRGSLVS